MKYRVAHSTVYTYTEAVPVCHNELHLTPRDRLGQTCGSSRLVIKPTPNTVEHRSDYFGNRVAFFTLQEGHQKLVVTAISKVEVHESASVTAQDSMPWEQVRDRLPQDRSPVGVDSYQFVFDSPFVAAQAALADYASQSFLPDRPWVEAALDLTDRIHRDFQYDPRATTIHTPLERVLRDRRGVCQDFAHLEIGCLRSLGLAARYVSGYLLTNPPPGQPRLVGADASHAWASIYGPDRGWLDFDPTNNQVPGMRHITLAWGRDYSDVCPIKGVFVGGGQHGMSVSVDVAPLGDDADLRSRRF